MKDLLRHSRWSLEWREDPESALPLLDRMPVQAVVCDAEWASVALGTRWLRHPPVVIALDENPSDEHCLNALSNDALYVDARRLTPQKLFPLLSHAWQVWNEHECREATQ